MLYKKYLFALLKKYKWFYLAMALLAAISTALLLGSCSAVEGFSRAYDDYLEKYGYSDIVITTEMAKYKDLEKVEEIEGVDKVNVRASTNCNLKVDSSLLTIRLITVPNDAIIDLYIVDECEKSTDYPNVSIERRFADNNGIKVGDIVNIQFTDEYKECYVEKIVQSSETTFFNVTSFMTSDNIDSGCIYLDEDEYYSIIIKSLFFRIKYANEIIIKVKDGYDFERVKDDCVALLENENIKVKISELGENTLCRDQMSNFINTVEKIAFITPLVFYSIMLIFSLLFFILIIKNSYKDIGILMMIGYKKSQIISLFSLCSLFTSIFSIVLGILPGLSILSYFSGLLLHNYIIPYTYKEMNIRLILLSAIITVFVGQLACLLSSIQLRSSSPVSVWTDEKDVRSQKSGGKLQNSLPISLVLAINSHKRNPQGFLASTFAFFAAYFIIFLGLSINNSVDANIDQMINKRLLYDAQVVLIDEIDEDTNKKFCNEEYLLYTENSGIGGTTIEANGKSESCAFEVLSLSHKYWKIFDINNRYELSVPKDGVILDYGIADRLGISKGDIVILGGKEVKVVELSAMYASKFVVMSYETAEALGLDYLDTYIVSINDKQKLLNFFADEKIATFTIFSDSLGEKISYDSLPFKLITKVIIIFAILISFTAVCIVNISSFNEQRRRISIMRVLGNRVIDISNVWFLQFLISFAVSLIFSMPFSYGFTKNFLELISGKQYTYPFVNEPYVYLMTIGFIFGFYSLAHIITIQTVRHFNLADNTRSRE